MLAFFCNFTKFNKKVRQSAKLALNLTKRILKPENCVPNSPIYKHKWPTMLKKYMMAVGWKGPI